MPRRPFRAWQRLRLRFWRRPEDDRDVADEITFHLAEEERLRIARGMSPADAHASTRRDFGNTVRVAEVTRSVRTFGALETFGQDLRFAVRLLARDRLFSLFAIVSLALGIGATSAIFSLFDAIVLRKLPVADPDRLVALSFSMGSRANNYFPYPHFAEMRDHARGLEGLFAWTRTPRASLGVQGQEEIVSVLRASGAYHPTLGLTPALGRLLTDSDDDTDGTAAVVSYGYWQRRFGGNPGVIGTDITLNRLPFTIVGVEPRGFVGVNVGVSSDVTVPLRTSQRFADNAKIWDDAFATWIEVMGRQRADVSIGQTAEELKLIYNRVNTSVASRAPGDEFAQRVAKEAFLIVSPAARGGLSGLRSGYERWLLLLLMMLSAVVLLASLNVATLLLARAEARRDEMATRLAIGASRWRLIRQLMTESLVIAGLSGLLGLMMTSWASELLLRMVIVDGSLPVDLGLGTRTVAFAAIVSITTCLLFGLAPALRTTGRMRHSGSRGQSPPRRTLDRVLVAAQTGVSLVLLILAALFVRSLQNLWSVDPGYDRSQVVLFSVDAALAGQPASARVATYRSVLDALREMPGATNVSVSVAAPVSNTYYLVDSLTQAGTTRFPDNQRPRLAFNVISPGYFETMRIPLVAGRDFDDRDRVGSPDVAIISERLASRFTGNPVGQRVGTSGGTLEVIGVARDNRYANVKDAPRDVIYFPMFQSPDLTFTPTFEVRHARPAAEILGLVRETVTRVNPALSVFHATTLEARTRDSLSRERLIALLSSYVGGFALLLACIGLYGLLMYGVVRRTPELGLRVALGSQPAGIRRIVLKDSLATVGAGLLIGLAAAWWVVGFVRTQLYALEPTDPMAFAGATAVLLAVAATAAYIPAWRASRIDPVIALRRE